jgi:hypothetical protein
MAETLEDKILSYLKETGYPLELEAASALESHGWSVSSSPIYLDPEEGKYRELDLTAVKLLRVDSTSPIDPTILLQGHGFAFRCASSVRNRASRGCSLFVRLGSRICESSMHLESRIS